MQDYTFKMIYIIMFNFVFLCKTQCTEATLMSLLSNGADPTVQNAYGEVVLHLTALSPARIQAILEDGRCIN